jgi:hypothetical protein
MFIVLEETFALWVIIPAGEGGKIVPKVPRLIFKAYPSIHKILA